ERAIDALLDGEDLQPRDLGARAAGFDFLERRPSELGGERAELDDPARSTGLLQRSRVVAGDLPVSTSERENLRALDTAWEEAPSFRDVHRGVFQDIDELEGLAERRGTLAKVGGRVGERWSFQQKEIGQHLADDSRDRITVGFQVFERVELQLAVP